MTAPGKPLDLDGMEKVALDADAPHEHARPWEVHDGILVKRRNPSNEHIATSRDYAEFIATFDPPAVLALIQTQRELVGALKALREVVKDHPDFQGRQFVSLGIQVNNVLTKALGEQPL